MTDILNEIQTAEFREAFNEFDKVITTIDMVNIDKSKMDRVNMAGVNMARVNKDSERNEDSW